MKASSSYLTNSNTEIYRHQIKMAICLDDEKEVLDFVLGKGNGVKGLVDSGVSKVPSPFIQPPDQRTHQLCTHRQIQKLDSPEAQKKNSEDTKDTKAVWMISEPIDLSKLDGPDHDLVVKAIATAAEMVGFFQVVNHGVPLELLDSLIESAYRFFNQRPQEKAVYHQGVSPSPLVKYGTSFLPEKDLALEWRDYLRMFYTNDEEALLHWPKECREDALKYLNSSRKMVRRIMEILLQNIGLPHDNTRADSLIYPRTVYINFYPACPNPDLTVGVKGHSDISALTVLLQDGIGGLQVKLEVDLADQAIRKGEWIEISPVSGALVVNIGDTLQIISNGQYKSAEHRVRTTKNESRVSVPLFLSPQVTEKIGPLPHLVERDGVCRYREILYVITNMKQQTQTNKIQTSNSSQTDKPQQR